MSLRRRLTRALSALVWTAAMLAGPSCAGSGSNAMAQRPAQANGSGSTAVPLTVDTASSGPAIHPGFLGLSIEYWALESYAGKDPRAINPVLVRLLRNLAPQPGALIRIGGVTTDWTWWPVGAAVRKPRRVRYILSNRRLEVARALAQALAARLMLGIQFEASSQLEATAESHAMLHTIGRGRIAAFELGNEPDVYRPRWNVQRYLSQFKRITAALGNAPVAGPALGSISWLDKLGEQLSRNPHLVVVTTHKYPLEGCASTPRDSDYPSIPHLLAPTSAHGIAEFLRPYVATAHAHHVQIRDGEMNSSACGNGAGVTNTFASALWALDTMFELADSGVDGVNIHTYPSAPGQLFTFRHAGSRWLGSVKPEYYGLLAFVRAAPAGSRLLSVSGSDAPATLHTWATRAPDGTVRVVLINESTDQPVSALVAATNTSGPARLERLQAPSMRSTSGVRIDGQSFSPRMSTGRLNGHLARATVTPNEGAYLVQLPAASAATLTLP